MWPPRRERHGGLKLALQAHGEADTVSAGDRRAVNDRSRKVPLAVALLSTGLALAVYLRTMAPTITFRHSGADSGDLVTAAINLGVPHPTGYPLYTLLAHLFTWLPGEPARNVNLFSALCGALAVGVVFWAAHRLIATRESDGPLALIAAFSAAGVFGFGQLLWSQATIAEVYSLNALWAAASLAALLASGPARPYIVAFLFGMGLAHHVTAIWLLPALWPYVGSVRRWLTPRRAFLVLLCLLPGLLAYLYVPIRARVHPVPNWGLATDLPGFLWLVSGEAYRRYFGGVVPAQVLQRFAAWAGIWVRDLGVIGLALALLGLWRGFERDRRFTAFGLSYVLFLSAHSMLYVTGDSYVYLLPAAAVVALWMAWGAYGVLRELRHLGGTAQRLGRLAMVALLALPLVSAVSRFRDLDLSLDREAYVSAESLLQAAAPNGLILSRGDSQTFSLWYVRYGLRQRPDVVVVDRYLLAMSWYRTDLAARNSELAPLLQAQDDQEAALMLLSIPGRPVHLAYQDDPLLGHGEWTKEGSLYTLVQ
jgi:hypothetical protein